MFQIESRFYFGKAVNVPIPLKLLISVVSFTRFFSALNPFIENAISSNDVHMYTKVWVCAY